MEQSILTGTKKILSIAENYIEFDYDIITHINSTFAILQQLGIPEDGFMIEDASATWADIGLTEQMENMVRTYVYLKVRMLFDPPPNSFLIEAMNDQIQEYEHRLSWTREEIVPLQIVD